MNPFAEFANHKSQIEDRLSRSPDGDPLGAHAGQPKSRSRRDTIPHVGYRQGWVNR